MLLPYLNPSAPDAPDALRIGDDKLSREDLAGVATAVAERIAGARVVAVLARPTTETVLAVLGGLIAGVTVVPVPPDSGPREIAHILGDSGHRAGSVPPPTTRRCRWCCAGTPSRTGIPSRPPTRSR